MKPVDMMVVHDPAAGRIGDCFRCCIASILELPAPDVPHFMIEDWGKEKDFTWYPKLTSWLAARGLAYFEHTIAADFHGPRWFALLAAAGFDVFHVMSGVSPRARHSVVARNGVMVHDPHPSRDGLIGPGDDGWTYGFILLRGAA